MQLHVEALFIHDANGHLLHVNEPGGAAAPRFFLGATVDGTVIRFRSDVEPRLRKELEEAAAEDIARRRSVVDVPIGAARYEAILARAAPVQRTWIGPAFCFPEELPTSSSATIVGAKNQYVLEAHLRPWLPDVLSCQPMVVLTVGDEAVCVCCSVRRTNRAHEAGVETALPYRGRGCAVQAVSVWAQAVRDLGCVPLYSTSWQNEASRAVARKLGLTCFGSDVHVT